VFARLKIILVQFIARDCLYNTRWLCTPSASGLGVDTGYLYDRCCLCSDICKHYAYIHMGCIIYTHIYIYIIYKIYAPNTLYYNIYYAHWITMTVALYIQYTRRKSGQRCVGIDRERDYCCVCVCVCVYSGAVFGRMTAVNGEREYKKEKQNTRNRRR